MNTARVESLQVGKSAEIRGTGTEAWWDCDWVTGFRKAPMEGRVWLGYGGLRGDEQADRQHHGGVDKAVCVYALEHYGHWQEVLGGAELPMGAFGENFSTRGFIEDGVCIGDVYAIGDARVQVSQPRQPCWKLARRWRRKDLAVLVEQTGFTGFYFRVLRHGWVAAGMSLERVERPHPEITVARANRVMHHAKDDREAARDLAGCPALSASWKDALWSRAERLDTVDPERRRAQP